MSDKKSNIFNSHTHDLGNANIGVSKEYIDNSFLGLPSNELVCCVCQQPARYQLVSKVKELSTAALEDKGYVCEHHLQYMDPNTYGIREVR